MICEVQDSGIEGQSYKIIIYYVWVYFGIGLVVECDVPIIYAGMTNKKLSGTLSKKPWHRKPSLIGHTEPTAC